MSDIQEAANRAQPMIKVVIGTTKASEAQAGLGYTIPEEVLKQPCALGLNQSGRSQCDPRSIAAQAIGSQKVATLFNQCQCCRAMADYDAW